MAFTSHRVPSIADQRFQPVTSLCLADIHMTNVSRDRYRWGLFPWVEEQVKKHDVDQVIIAGDLTDAKDRHPATLVERLVSGVARVAALCPVIILKGNHDYIDPEHPFFGFLSKIHNVSFICEPTQLNLRVARGVEKCVFLPSDNNWREAWDIEQVTKADYIFTHCTYAGCRLDNGTRAPDGIPTDVFGDFEGQVLSGDIHVPQRLGQPYGPEYIGSPYHIDFGDRFVPRALLIEKSGKFKDLRFPCPEKIVWDIEGDGPLENTPAVDVGDQVKIRVYLKRASFPSFPKMRGTLTAWAEEQKVELFGPTLHSLEEKDSATVIQLSGHRRVNPSDAVRQFAIRKKAGDRLRDIGLEIIKGAE